jgi:uncharacterized membrane protein
MVMIQATMIVIVAVVAISVRVAVVIISAMYTPMNTPMMAIVGLRLVHGQ